MMDRNKVVSDIFDELRRAEKMHPGWPKNLFEAAAIIGEEFGELQQAMLRKKHEGGSIDDVYNEAIQTAAMGIRFCLNLALKDGE